MDSKDILALEVRVKALEEWAGRCAAKLKQQEQQIADLQRPSAPSESKDEAIKTRVVGLLQDFLGKVKP